MKSLLVISALTFAGLVACSSEDPNAVSGESDLTVSLGDARACVIAKAYQVATLEQFVFLKREDVPFDVALTAVAFGKFDVEGEGTVYTVEYAHRLVFYAEHGQYLASRQTTGTFHGPTDQELTSCE